MTKDNNLIRFFGTGIRESIAGMHFHHGHEMGFRFARRAVFEIGAFIAEVQSKEIAADMCMGVGDDMLGNKVRGDDAPAFLLNLGKEAASVEPAAPPAAPPVVDVVPECRVRIQETTAWLQKHAPSLLVGFEYERGGRDDAMQHVGYLRAMRDVAALGSK
jgi:hypothetical protein